MALLTNPDEINEFLSGAEVADYSAPSSFQNQQTQQNTYGPSTEEEDSSILGTAWEKMKLQAEGFIAANVEDPELSNYARNRYVSQYRDWKQENEKLGTVGQVASEAVASAPAIAAFLSTPLTGAAGVGVGSALSGLQSTGEALIGQYEQGQDFDFNRAAEAGLRTAGTDIMLGGAGHQLGKAVGQLYKRPGATGMSALAVKAAPAAADIAVADMGSAGAAQIYQNLATGRDWDEGVGGAALVGGVAGAGVRGVSRGFNGISEKLGIQFNKGGEDAITKAATINRESGVEANPEFSNSFVDAENAASGIKQRIDEMDIDDPNLGSAIGELNSLSNAKSVESAMAELGTIIPSLHMNTKGFDITIKDFNGKEINLGTDVLGMDRKTMNQAATNTSKVTKSMFQDEDSALQAGLSPEAFKKKLHDTYNKKFKEGRGHLGDNIFELEKRIEVAKRSGADNLHVQRLEDLKSDLNTYKGLIDKSLQAPSKAEEVHNRIQYLSDRIRENAIRTGENANLKSFTGKQGDFDGSRDFLVFTGLHDSALAQDPSFVYGTSDPLSAKAADKDFNPFNVVRNVLKAPGRAITQPYRRMKAEQSIKAAQEMGRELAARKPKARMEASLAEGDAAGAARASAAALEEEGISVPHSPVEEVVVPSTPEPMPEMPVEAPVTTVDVVEPSPKVDARTKVAPAPKAVEEAPAPAPKKKAKAKSKTTPKKKEKVKEEGPTPEAVQQARAELAAALQQGIQAGMKRGETVQAQSRTAPKEKEVIAEPEPVVEAPVAAPVEPKGRKTPNRKVKEEEVVEVVPEPVVEVPAPKPEAKAAKAPKQKEEPVTEEPAQEAPQKARTEPLGRKEPTRTKKEEEATESITEPVAGPAPEPEAPKAKPYAQLIREPLQKIVDQPIRPSVKGANELIQARSKAKKDLQDIHMLENKNSNYSQEDIARVIHESGGMDGLREAATANGVNISQQTKARLMELENLRKREAAEKTREMKETLVKKSKETAPKVEEKVAAKSAQREFDGEMEARGYHEEDVATVNKAIEDGMSHKNARIYAQRLNAERKEQLKKDIKDADEVLKESNAVLKNEGKRAQVDDYLKGINIEADKDISKMINNVFKHRSDEIKPREMQTLLNKIDKYLENQASEYDSLMRAGGKADPRYPEWNDLKNAFRSSQSDLKRNRAQVDRVVEQSRQAATEAATEHAKLVKEYDKLFDQANTRDANANKVVKQKDELVRDLEDKGFTAEEAEAAVANAFYKRETTPMNEREMQKTINKFVEEKARARNEEVDQKVRAVKEEVSKADDATLVEMGEAVADEIKYSPKMDGNDDEVAMMKAISEEMGKRDNRLAKRYESFVEAILKGSENRTKYPDNPELWVPANTLQDIQKTFGTGTSSYSGRMGVALNLALTGNKEGVKGFGTLDRQVIASRIKKMNQADEGKLIMDSDEFTAK